MKILAVRKAFENERTGDIIIMPVWDQIWTNINDLN
jgi:hypothetical protein